MRDTKDRNEEMGNNGDNLLAQGLVLLSPLK